MPGYIIHLTEAKMITKILEERKQLNNDFSHEWNQKFFYGALLPDAVEKTKKGRSHFWNEDKIQIIMQPQIDRFLDKYGISLNNPVALGYLAHLDLDNKFWNEYVKKSVEFLDENRNATEKIESLKCVYLKEKKESITAEQFFSEDYLYGDYTILNKELIDTYNIEVPKYDTRLNGLVQEVENKEMKNVLDKLEKYTLESKKTKGDTKVLSLNKLKLFLQETAQKFIREYIN